MKKIIVVLFVGLFMVGCANKTPLPKCKGDFYPINGENF